MDVVKFQEQLNGICALAEDNNKTLTAGQVREYFSETELDKSQLLKVLQYLTVKGISIEGVDTAGEKSEDIVREPEETKVLLTPEEEAYLKEYLAGIEENTGDSRAPEELFEALAAGEDLAYRELSRQYLAAAAQTAVDMNCEEIFLADLIQEANLGLLTALGEKTDEEKNDAWLRGRILAAVEKAVEEQRQRKFQDDYLVTKVEKLEAAVKELSDDEEDGEGKFSAQELAVILDMDVEEIRDVLRLTGDDK